MLGPPRIHRGEELPVVSHSEPRLSQELGDLAPLRIGLRRLRRLAGRRTDAAVVGHRIALAEDLHGEVPHHLEAAGEALQVGSPKSVLPPRLFLHSADRAAHVDRPEVGLDGPSVRLLGPDAP